jgi:hypothetical protein
MKYVQPYGISDPNAPYINGDPSIGRQGSIPPAAAFEHPMRELVAIITRSFVTPSDTDLEQVAKSIRSQRMNYAEDTGSANTISCSFAPPITSYTVGLPLRVKIKVTNTGAVTINAGAGSAQVKRPNGSQLSAGDLTAGGLAELVYDGTSFILINFGGTGGAGTTNNYFVYIPYAVDSGAANTVTVSYSPPAGAPAISLAAGLAILIKINNTNTGPTTLNINGLGARPVFAQGGGALLPSDVVAGDTCLFIYDGTQFWISPNITITANCTINVANNTDLDNAFRNLGRKRIPPNITVTIKLAGAAAPNPKIFTPFTTYHTNADRIVVEGTMNGALPTKNDFYKTGNPSDTSNNLAMLRGRYGTEIQFTNAASILTGGSGLVAINHTGPGKITIKNILITGANSYGGISGTLGAIGPEHGCGMICDGVSVWGGGYNAFAVAQGTLDCSKCFSANSWGSGFYCYGGSTMSLYDCGAYGNAQDGMQSGVGSMLYLYQNNESMRNLWNGLSAWAGSTALLKNQNGVINNSGSYFDINATDISSITINSSVGNTWTTTTPATGVVGNFGSLIRIY